MFSTGCRYFLQKYLATSSTPTLKNYFESWVGVEPTCDGFANRSVNHFATRTFFGYVLDYHFLCRFPNAKNSNAGSVFYVYVTLNHIKILWYHIAVAGVVKSVDTQHLKCCEHSSYGFKSHSLHHLKKFGLIPSFF